MASAAAAQETYTVQQGDTLASIARQIAGVPVSWDDLCRINRSTIENCDLLRAGVVIALPEGARISDEATGNAVGNVMGARLGEPLRLGAGPTIETVEPVDSLSLTLGGNLDDAALQGADASLAAFFGDQVTEEPDTTVQEILEAVMAEPVIVPDEVLMAAAPAADEVADVTDTAVADADETPAETLTVGTVAYGANARPMAFRSYHGHEMTDEGGAVRISGHVPGLYSTGTTGGAFIRLDDEFEADAAANVVRVSVTMSGPEGARAALAYSTNDLGNSGWQSFILTAPPTTHSFEYAVPPLAHGSGDFLGIDPDPDGAGHAILVHAILLEILESDPN
ncbi:LysM peptidoglycan-binding domain-containing protein [Yoonia vestfoldensis]|uniref:LysM domain-containing protein n=1 Tax=Yoonia vestfoldensis SKA53 TaxID=314232 RepID=A3V6B1_9RHOB|nr:LysM domain-containing protein [Yoonia vestfoldensis]EAQ06435.1 hypothetical protein SKA53_05088 [Yoonia vestfoldensis SKA53]